ncbi:MAG TPA: hypothetical protein VGC69_06435 [Bordetella sp.]
MAEATASRRVAGRAVLWAGLLLGLATAAQAGEGPLLLSTRAAPALPGSGGSWGFAALDPTRPYLFIARRENGLTVFDVRQRKVVRQVPGTRGANGVAFVPRRNRAYVPNMDGTLTVVRLSDMKALARIPVARGNLNQAVYEPRSDRLLITSGRRADVSTIYQLDPATDRIVAQSDIAAKKLDPPMPLPDGRVLLPWRDEGEVAVWDPRSAQTLASWRYPACARPSALAHDGQGRVFIACRGAKPVLIVADAATGEQKAALPLLRNVNALAYDPARRWVLAPSGDDAALNVYLRQSPDDYRLLGQVGTRPWAHNMVLAPGRGEAYLFTADFTQRVAEPGAERPSPDFHPDTFTVLVLGIDPSSGK